MSEENDILYKHVWGIQDTTKGIYNENSETSLINECFDLRKQEAAVKTLIVKYLIS